MTYSIPGTEQRRVDCGDVTLSVYEAGPDRLPPAEARMEADVAATLRATFRRGVDPEEVKRQGRSASGARGPSDSKLGEPLLSEEELAVYVAVFEETGFTGGLNWYRNMDRNWEGTAHLDGARVEVPALMISAAWDLVLPPRTADAMVPLVPDLERHTIDGCGHWTAAEQPDTLNRLLIDWLTRRFR